MMMLLQVPAVETASRSGLVQWLIDFINTPAPGGPFAVYLVVLLVLWLIARRAQQQRESFDTQAQDVLDAKFADGELSKDAYDKYRQDVSLRPKR
jgi:hypothetical protein